MSASKPWRIRVNSRCAAGWWTCSPAARSMACGSISSATRSKASGPSIPVTSARPDGSTASRCCPHPKRCSTKKASGASAAAIVNASAPRRRVTRCIRRFRTGGGWRAWSIGFRCLRTRWRRCSIILATARSSSAIRVCPRPTSSGWKRSPITTPTASAPNRTIPAAIARFPPIHSISIPTSSPLGPQQLASTW